MFRLRRLKCLRISFVGCLICLLVKYMWISNFNEDSENYHQPRAEKFLNLFSNKDNTFIFMENELESLKPASNITQIEISLDRLDREFGPFWQWEWIKSYVHNHWSQVLTAAQTLSKKNTTGIRKSLKILVVPGFLTVTNFAQPSVAFHGGPVGELRQWADLVAALHVLGHKLQLLHDLRMVKAGLSARVERSQPSLIKGCQLDQFDLVFTDVQGWDSLPEGVQNNIRLKVRFFDVFGTEVMYNVPSYAQTHNAVEGAGENYLCPRQFLTMYPEVPDNTFLGFMVHGNPQKTVVQKLAIGIIYGKSINYLKGRENLLQVLQKHLELHCTIDGSTEKYGGLINHGVLPGESYQEIVAKAKFFIGLGDPIEGPGPMEALTRGCVFMQPRFEPPLRLKGKPNNRTYSSQIPYLEHRIGPPHVLTLNYNNLTEVDLAVSRAINKQRPTKIPYEFSAVGYLERIDNLTQKVDYCKEDTGCFVPWPEISFLQVILAEVEGLSCTDSCMKKGLICEYNYFSVINSKDMFEKEGKTCQIMQEVADVYAPAYIEDSGTCLFQSDSDLYSCSSYIPGSYHRLCPCRSYSFAQ